MFKVRRHGAEDNCRKAGRRNLFAERRSRHSTSGSGNCLKLQPDLPTESADRQEKGAEGKSDIMERNGRGSRPNPQTYQTSAMYVEPIEQ